mmetsp:Transcript_2120/g.4984  ORF Transcript_2120/g.4984 Transcript_2120/m.4984 type:complete len:441 (+) Transcript_2120:136-1458(+)
MGNLLGSPVTEKDTHVGETPEGIHFGVSSMQGWRIHMEDAHIMEAELYAEEPARVEGDRFKKLTLPGHSLFAVFDGHGGSFAAAYAGKNLCRVLSRQPKFVAYAKFVHERPRKEAALAGGSTERAQYVRSGMELLEGALCDAFLDLDREILLSTRGEEVADANTPYHDEVQKDENMDESSDDPAKDGNNSSNADTNPKPNDDEDAGTTAVVVVVTPQWVVCANAGDSRSVFSKHGNKAVPLSYDHKPDDEEEERRIRAAGGYVAGGRVEGDLAVSRGFGDYRFKNKQTVAAGSNFLVQSNVADTYDQKEANRTMMQADDQKVSPMPDIIVQNRSTEQDEFIIVACDGIWDVQSNPECVKTVADIFKEGESDMGLVCEELLDLCLGMGSKDNMTALIVRFPAQKMGTGGGVMARRRARDNSAMEVEDAGGSGGDANAKGKS